MTAVVHPSSVFFFGTIVLLVLWAFWPGYFSSLPNQRDVWRRAIRFLKQRGAFWAAHYRPRLTKVRQIGLR